MINSVPNLHIDVVDEWSEIFQEVTLNSLPLEYVETVRITFEDDRIWEIAVESKAPKNKRIKFTKGIIDLLHNYSDVIQTVDVQINTELVRKDVERSIKKMLRKTQIWQSL